jgi:hypothetical protein
MESMQYLKFTGPLKQMIKDRKADINGNRKVYVNGETDNQLKMVCL